MPQYRVSAIFRGRVRENLSTIRSLEGTRSVVGGTVSQIDPLLRRNWKDRVSREITGPFVKCKIRNASPQKWNKPRHMGMESSLAVVVVRQRHSNRKGAVDERGISYVYVYVSHLSAQILLWLYAVAARNFTYVRTFVPSRYNIRT